MVTVCNFLYEPTGHSRTSVSRIIYLGFLGYTTLEKDTLRFSGRIAADFVLWSPMPDHDPSAQDETGAPY